MFIALSWTAGSFMLMRVDKIIILKYPDLLYEDC